ncbi:MAG: type I-E CRISPR-associated protein Cas5/CasD [Eubacteriales bacterium]|nr:type I-E CRISPR-associated protein Cas5/CasD [Eubacteriales bacterium]
MSTLLLRLTAPLQAWGADARFERRGTERMPTKSGIVGMLAAALGIKRNEDISQLAALRFGVRTDREGSLLRDFHTARHPVDEKRAYITTRYYLEDAVFLVGLEGDDATLCDLQAALMHPAYPLFLGRRSCPPSGQLVLGIRPKSLKDALMDEPPLVDKMPYARMSMDSEDQGGRLIRDVPMSFDQSRRSFGFRLVKDDKVDFVLTSAETKHDPMSELED